MIRAKMKVTSVENFEGVSEQINFCAVGRNEQYPDDGSDENNTFAKFTPSADLTMCITNPDLLGKIKQGDEFYLDFSKVGKQSPVTTGD